MTVMSRTGSRISRAGTSRSNRCSFQKCEKAGSFAGLLFLRGELTVRDRVNARGTARSER
jgi:hypothetical protein